MCGIIGYIGKENATPIIFEGLKKSEYRGYDSAGISVSEGGRLMTVKAKGKLSALERLLEALPYSHLGIGHTRWATHGEPNEINSHPHLSTDGKFAIVHNGIIENAAELRRFLCDRGFEMVSDTDSEVIAHLLEYYYHGDMLAAIKSTALKLKGAYALAILSSYTDELYAVKKDSPLIIGLGKNESVITSDIAALPSQCKEYLLPEDNEIGVITEGKAVIYSLGGEPVEKPYFINSGTSDESDKLGYPHYMLKEIFEQPAALENTLAGFSEPDLPKSALSAVILCGCGSAYHAALLSSRYFSRLGVPVSVMYASEFRYCDPLIDSDTLFIAISQSGETADTLFSLRLASEKGAMTAAVVNVANSSIYREAQIKIPTRAGREIAVATTKGFTTQVEALRLFSAYLTLKAKKITPEEFSLAKSEIAAAASALKTMLSDLKIYQKTAYDIFSAKNIFFIGRREDYALAKEGALKLKEISYIHAESYPAGELKHGTISLIERGSICFAPVTCADLKEKMLSNIKEITARGGSVYVITPFRETFSADAKVLPIPIDGAVYCAASVMQLIAYYTASLKGLDIDKPRNLAKSVTVE